MKIKLKDNSKITKQFKKQQLFYKISILLNIVLIIYNICNNYI